MGWLLWAELEDGINAIKGQHCVGEAVTPEEWLPCPLNCPPGNAATSQNIRPIAVM